MNTNRKSLVYDYSVGRYVVVDSLFSGGYYPPLNKGNEEFSIATEDAISVLSQLQSFELGTEDWLDDYESYSVEYESLFSTLSAYAKKWWNKLTSNVKALWNKILGKKKEEEIIKDKIAKVKVDINKMENNKTRLASANKTINEAIANRKAFLKDCKKQLKECDKELKELYEVMKKEIRKQRYGYGSNPNERASISNRIKEVSARRDKYRKALEQGV